MYMLHECKYVEQKKKATRLYPKFDIIIVNTCVITIEHLTKTLHGEIIKRFGVLQVTSL